MLPASQSEVDHKKTVMVKTCQYFGERKVIFYHRITKIDATIVHLKETCLSKTKVVLKMGI